MIQYHGRIDASPQPRGSIEYYENVVADQVPRDNYFLFARNVGLRNMQSFYRFFMVPGMEHCTGGPGPNAFGQPFSPVPPPSNDARHDALTALERWVERGRVPNEIIATKYVNDDSASGIQTQRPLCPYPQEAQWDGQGSADEAKNYTCWWLGSRARGGGHSATD